MDKTVPAGAAILLDFIRQTEVDRSDRASYDVIYANKQGTLAKPLTSMTLDEVIAAQSGWTKSHGSSAAGGYQFMRATLRELMVELKLKGSQKLDPDLQDRLGYHLLKRRGYLKFVAGEISMTAFGKLLAQEWASFPVLAPTAGQKRSVARGQSYYAGDGLNKALVKPEKVEAVLRQVLDAAKRPQASSPDIGIPISPVTAAPAPAAPAKSIAAALVVAIAGAAAWAASVPCSLFGVMCQ